jgi:hypothetical protein
MPTGNTHDGIGAGAGPGGATLGPGGGTGVGGTGKIGLGWQFGGEPLCPGGHVAGGAGCCTGTQRGGMPTVPAGHGATGSDGTGGGVAGPAGIVKQKGGIPAEPAGHAAADGSTDAGMGVAAPVGKHTNTPDPLGSGNIVEPSGQPLD